MTELCQPLKACLTSHCRKALAYCPGIFRKFVGNTCYQKLHGFQRNILKAVCYLGVFDWHAAPCIFRGYSECCNVCGTTPSTRQHTLCALSFVLEPASCSPAVPCLAWHTMLGSVVPPIQGPLAACLGTCYPDSSQASLITTPSSN